MNISWVVAESYQFDPTVDVDSLKHIGPIWGSWKTWRGCSTDNVICHNRSKAQELIKRKLQEGCNFYIPEKNFQAIQRPTNVKIYKGEFEQETDTLEDIIALHLCVPTSDIILMAGFDLSPIVDPGDRYELHKIKNYHGMLHSLISSCSDKQFVLVNYQLELAKSYRALTNLTCDTMENVLQLLAQ